MARYWRQSNARTTLSVINAEGNQHGDCERVAALRQSVYGRGRRVKPFLSVVLMLACSVPAAPQSPSFPARGDKATVLIFVSSDCPVSNRYAPDIRKLHDEFTPQGVRFWLVYPSVLDDAAAIDKHVKDYGHPAAALADRDHQLVKLVGATVTPEAAV